MDNDDVVEAIGSALMSALQRRQQKLGPAIPLNDEAKALCQEYLKTMKVLCDRDEILKSEHEMIEAQLSHTKKLFIKQMEAAMGLDADGYVLNEKEFTIRCKLSEEDAADKGKNSDKLEDQPGWVKDAIENNPDKMVH